MAGPCLPDLDTLYQAGIDPRTKLPTKVKDKSDCARKADVKRFLRLIDEQDAVNRYVWYNLPSNITSQELERMLYYKGQLCFFYDRNLEEFYFMPYALDGTIDFYGRYNTIHPVPMTSGTEDRDGKAQAQYLSTLKLKCRYGVLTDVGEDDLYGSTVLLHDYSKQRSQTITPRVEVNDALLDVMADCVPFAWTALMASTGISGIRVADADQQANVLEASKSIEHAARNGRPFVPIVGAVEFQDLTNKPSGNVQDYLLAMQSFDNLRLSGYGIDNGGLFEKKAHELQTEADINGGPVGLVLQDGLAIRQNFCIIANSIWGLGIWCEASETATGVDRNGDGTAYDEASAGAEADEGGEGDDAAADSTNL